MNKKIIKSLRQYKTESIITIIFVILEVIANTLTPFVITYLLKYGFEQNSINNVLIFGGILILLAILVLVFGLLNGFYAAKASIGLEANIRYDMFKRIQRFSFYNLDRFQTASLTNRMTNDISRVRMSYQMMIRMVIKSPITIMFAFTLSAFLNIQISLYYLIAIPVILITIGILAYIVRPIMKQALDLYDDFNRVVQENIRAVREVKAFVKEKEESEKFNKVSTAIFKLMVKGERYLSATQPFLQTVIYVMLLAISFTAAKIIVATNGEVISTATIGSLIMYAMQILINLMMFSFVIVSILFSKPAADRLKEVLIEEPDLANCSDPIMEVKNYDIEFSDVSFKYSKESENFALKNINIKIKEGQTIGIIGATGSSKTTFVQLIPRLYDVSKGILKIGNLDVKKYDIETLRDSVSVVLQKNVLFSGTISQNLRWGNENATEDELKWAAKIAQADEFINQFENKYESMIEQEGTNVSGGQKQRLCIARALLKNPKILILDDSTSAIDTRTNHMLQESLKKDLPNMTKIIISQRIASISNADKIIVFDDGQINAFDTHDNLLKNNIIYREVYESQTNRGDFDEN